MNRNQPSHFSVIDHSQETFANKDEQFRRQPRATSTNKAKRNRREPRRLESPRDRLAITFRKCRETAGISLPNLAERSGIDKAHIWRLENGERPETSRETLVLLSLALVLDEEMVDCVVEVANEILDAAGLKMLRAPCEGLQESQHARELASERTGPTVGR